MGEVVYVLLTPDWTDDPLTKKLYVTPTEGVAAAVNPTVPLGHIVVLDMGVNVTGRGGLAITFTVMESFTLPQQGVVMYK